MKTVATVECRMTSSRLPGKVMLESCGRPMLEHLVARLKAVSGIDAIVLATTVNAQDDVIEELAARLGVGCYRGSEDDVLDRVLKAAYSVKAELIVEITGDCPLVDPELASQVLKCFLANDCDYVSNDLFPSYPLGMDVQVFTVEALEQADREGRTQEDREHVSWYIVQNPQIFRQIMLPAPQELHWPDLRITLDEQADYNLINALIHALGPDGRLFSCHEIVRYLRAHPELLNVNKGVVQRIPGQHA